MNIEALNLIDPVLSVARDLKRAFPTVCFTSGRRTIAEQAEVMACNVMVNRKWVEQTYRISRVSVVVQAEIDAHQQPMNHANMSGIILRALAQFDEKELAHLSKHLGGLAFDVLPNDNHEMKQWLHVRAAAIGGTFLEKEGGLARFHFQA